MEGGGVVRAVEAEGAHEDSEKSETDFLRAVGFVLGLS
jgi:hypothetical protein